MSVRFYRVSEISFCCSPFIFTVARDVGLRDITEGERGVESWRNKAITMRSALGNRLCPKRGASKKGNRLGDKGTLFHQSQCPCFKQHILNSTFLSRKIKLTVSKNLNLDR